MWFALYFYLTDWDKERRELESMKGGGDRECQHSQSWDYTHKTFAQSFALRILFVLTVSPNEVLGCSLSFLFLCKITELEIYTEKQFKVYYKRRESPRVGSFRKDLF
jgi:hypothetical protein